MLLVLGSSLAAIADEGNATGVVAYKQVGSKILSLHYVLPRSGNSLREAVVMIHGGGWLRGSPRQFEALCRHFAEAGHPCFSPEYRTRDNGNGSPFDALQDVRDAVAWLSVNSASYGLISESIVLGGASAGGQLAAALALRVPAVGDEPAFLAVRVSRLLLINPVVDNGPSGFGNALLGRRWPDFSPLHNVRRIDGHVLIMSGDRDPLARPEMLKKFCKALIEVKTPCELRLFADGGHGFFNYREGKNPYFYQMAGELVSFLGPVVPEAGESL